MAWYSLLPYTYQSAPRRSPEECNLHQYSYEILKAFNLQILCAIGIIYYWYSSLGPVWAETRVQSGDWYGSGTLHPEQVLRGS